MELKFKIEKSKIVEGKDKMNDIVTSLDDGTYIMSIKPFNSLKTERDFQKAYFAMVDICSMESGNGKNQIHHSFKKNAEIATTTDLTIFEWKELLVKFRWWAYENLDCIV